MRALATRSGHNIHVHRSTFPGAFFFRLGIVALSLNCSNRAGLGEKCGCGSGECADGLVCYESAGVCEEDMPPSPQCNSSAEGCPAGKNAFLCFGGVAPNDPYSTDCMPAASGSSGSEVYCCTNVPHCSTVGNCGAAGAAIELQCTDSVVPQDTMPGVACATLDTFMGGAFYCCAPDSECFRSDFGCYNMGDPYVCTGDASPTNYGLACGASPYADAGTSGTYCCVRDAAASD
jgi:hypothetical protein